MSKVFSNGEGSPSGLDLIPNHLLEILFLLSQYGLFSIKSSNSFIWFSEGLLSYSSVDPINNCFLLIGIKFLPFMFSCLGRDKKLVLSSLHNSSIACPSTGLSLIPKILGLIIFMASKELQSITISLVKCSFYKPSLSLTNCLLQLSAHQ